jgi:hypothetical protein
VSTTTVTEAWFLALERNIAGPPMSMFSVASSKVQSGLAIMAQNDINPIDLVVVNLYPFQATIANPDCTLEDATENIDIGGLLDLNNWQLHHHIAPCVQKF